MQQNALFLRTPNVFFLALTEHTLAAVYFRAILSSRISVSYAFTRTFYCQRRLLRHFRYSSALGLKFEARNISKQVCEVSSLQRILYSAI